MENFRTFNLAVEFYRTSRALALKKHLRDQLLRAASSVALNLAEGRGKPTIDDQVRFFNIAFGSVRECQGILILDDRKGNPEWALLDRLAASLYRLIHGAR